MLARALLNLRICLADTRTVILDGRGHISRQRLWRIMIQPKQRGTLGIIILPEPPVANNRKGVGDARGLHAVLAQIFLMRVAHKRPAIDILEPRYHCKKSCLPYFASVFYSH